VIARLRVLKLFAFVIVSFGAVTVADIGQAIGENFLVPQEDRMRDLVNQVRSGRGVRSLPDNDGLRWMARRQAQAMSAAGYIFHTPNLQGAADAQAMPWLSLGENVGKGPSVEAVHQAFLSSPGHLSNVVNPTFDAVGVGATADASQQALYFTQSFAHLERTAAPAAVRPSAGAGQETPAPPVGQGAGTTPEPAVAEPTDPRTPAPSPATPEPQRSPGTVGPGGDGTDVVGAPAVEPRPAQPTIWRILLDLAVRFVGKLAFWI